MIEQQLRTPLTELVGVRHPVVQTGMGWVAGPRLVSATANAGGPNAELVSTNIARSFVAFCDDDRDGRDDRGE